MAKHYQVVIVGGGAGGIMVSAQLLKKDSSIKLAIIEPSEKHHYQPAYSLVGAGTYNLEDTVHDEANYIPSKATWIKQYAQELKPADNKVVLANGDELTYDYLVVTPGISFNLSLVEGLEDALKKTGIGSVCKKFGINFMDIAKSEFIEKEFENFKVKITKEIFEKDLIINVPASDNP